MAREVIRIRDEFYIRSSSHRIDVRTRVLKQADTFAVFDRFGDIEPFGTGELGIYYQDTRFLHRLTLKLGKDRPLLLSSTVREDNAVLAVDATNADVWRNGEIVIPHGTLHVFRSKILWERTCHERLRIHNYGRAPVEFSFSVEFDADFADIFEVRGIRRERRGQRIPTQLSHDGLVLAYNGLDACVRRTRIVFDPAATRLSESAATYQIRLEPGEEASYRWAIACEVAADSQGEVKPFCWYRDARACASRGCDVTHEPSFSGWGVRTVATSEARYNPMSYHNGSVWPHDNSLIAAGFGRYALRESTAIVLAGLLDASLFLDLHRLPELFCGFPRRPGEAPTLYPVACAPQSWASGAVFLLLEACLSLSISASEQRLTFSKPILPRFLQQVTIRGLKVADGRADLLLTRHDEGDVGVNVLRREGALDVVVLK